MSSLQTTNLYGGYENHPVFKHLDLQLPEGKFLALTGPNGSGKSTLLKFFYKELTPDKGAIYINDLDIHTLSQKNLARRLGFVPQNGHIEYGFTVQEAVSMGRYAYGGKDENHQVEQAMEDCDIRDLANERVTEISGGELQRVFLARALCQNGNVLLLDEPVNHLDVKHQRTMMTLLKRLVEKNMSVVCVLHDLLLVQVYSDEVILLKKGNIYAQGATQKVICQETLRDVYKIESHQVYDATLNKTLWMPTWC